MDTPEGVATGSVQIAPQSPVGGVWKKDYKDFAPRVGFAWDVFGDGKTRCAAATALGTSGILGNVTFNVIQNPPNYATIDVTSNQLVAADFGRPTMGRLRDRAERWFCRLRSCGTSIRTFPRRMRISGARPWSGRLRTTSS